VTWRLGAALTIALAAIGCGGGGGSDAPKGKDTATATGRVQTAFLVLQTGRRPARHRITVDGNRIGVGHDWLLPLEIKLTNRRKRPLAVGRMTADVVAGGRHYQTVYADGRGVLGAPLFVDKTVPPGEAAHTFVLYHLPKKTLPKAVLRVRDPVRGATYNLRLF
jgi:hypothetical protein